MSRRVAVRAIVFDGERLFCVRHKAYGGKAERTHWCAPGGGLDEGEDLRAGLKREIIEEVGVEPVIGELLYIQQFIDKEDKQEQLEFFFNVINSNDFYKINDKQASHLDAEIEEYGFILRDDSRELLPSFLKTEDIEQHIKLQLPTKIFSYGSGIS